MFKILTKAKLRQKYFGFKTASYLSNICFTNLINIIDNNACLAHTPEEGYQPLLDGAVRTYKDGDIYAIYYDKVRLIIRDGKDKLVQVSLLGKNSLWKVWELDSKGKNIATIDSEATEAYTVYTFCDITMPTGRMMSDERYTKGMWNEYVYNCVVKIVEYVYSYKSKNKFNNYYKSINI